MFHSNETRKTAGNNEGAEPKIFSVVRETALTEIEKLFLLHAERGDCATVLRIAEECSTRPSEFNINCTDCLNRSALIMAIENENVELVKLLLELSIDVKDALLHAIKEEFVEAVEILLEWEENNHKSGKFYSWEQLGASSTFTSDITPLILAAHKNNYEIIKILLERGATLPTPHDVKCGCDECVVCRQTDSLRHSQARINAYKALTSPSLISLSSSDPLLTAFELSWELRRLSRAETEFRAEYHEMRRKVEDFATALLDHIRTSSELMLVLNYDHKNPQWVSGDRQTLERLKLAIKYKQKKYVAHPNVQQLLGEIWYEGVPGFRRKNIFGQVLEIVKFGVLFPVYCLFYMVAPTSKYAAIVKRPFVKFICHSSSYLFFLCLLGLSSQKIEIVVLEWFEQDWADSKIAEWKLKEKGGALSYTEYGVCLYVASIIVAECRAAWTESLKEYMRDLWNLVDIVMISFYLTWFSLRMFSLYTTWEIETKGGNPYTTREEWHTFDPILISEGAFSAGMIFSFLKLVHIFSVNPHLGPLQISLGRMIIDIVKFFFIYALVLFAFGCGLNQLLWYYADLERDKCFHLPTGLPDFETQDKACTIWRRYANLFETSQSLFWASFGLIDLMSFDLVGIKSFTRFWAMLMFGSYSVINIIVLLNMLIAMMANSYQIISERADVEWKFARSKLWISYFETGNVLPPPFNILPSTQIFCEIFTRRSFEDKLKLKVKDAHEEITKTLIKRYAIAEQSKRNEYGVNEDDVLEIRQDISTLRYDLLNLFEQNGMVTPPISTQEQRFSGRKGKIFERRILRGFSIGTVESLLQELKQKEFTIKKRKSLRKTKDWNTLVRSATLPNPIGTKHGDKLRIKRSSYYQTSPANLAAVYRPLDVEKSIESEKKRENTPDSPWF